MFSNICKTFIVASCAFVMISNDFQEQFNYVKVWLQLRKSMGVFFWGFMHIEKQKLQYKRNSKNNYNDI